MPSKINILPESLINKIAAGEVVERPASVVKELVENAIDAGSDQVFVTIKNGGKDHISILDNGSGMSEEDASLAIERHATSKIRQSEDLSNIMTMGFRGEALAAIAAVSRFELTTCEDENEGGFQVRVEGGKLTHTARIGFPKGTRIVVENLFFNTPARQKFMKSVNTEYNNIHSLVLRLALSNPHIQFRLIHNKSIVLNLPKGQDFKQRVQQCFGDDITKDLIECEYEESYLSFSALISTPSGARKSKRWQHIFVNNRHIKSQPISHAIYEGYKTLLMKNTHPAFFIKINLSPEEVDVNVHPAKTEIRLKNQNLIHTILSEQLSKTLKSSSRQKAFRTGADEMETTPINEADEQPSDTQATSPVDQFVEPNEQIGFTVPETPTCPSPKPVKQTEATPELDEVTREESDPFSFSSDQTETHVEPSSPEFVASPHRVIGQLSNKYILAQGEDCLVLVDQHAAHERIRFEEIRNQYYSRTLATNSLLIPLMIELAPQDGLLLEQYQDAWRKLGFTIDHFGGNDYSIKEIPAILCKSDIPEIIREVLDEMAQFGKSGKLELFYNEIFEKMACHSAIRASQPLSHQEMQSLLDQLSSLDLQLHCPHGRPVMIEISLDELDKRFKR